MVPLKSLLRMMMFAFILGLTTYRWLEGITICYKRIYFFLNGLLFLILFETKILENIIFIMVISFLLWSIQSQNSDELLKNPQCLNYGSELSLLIPVMLFDFSFITFTIICLTLNIFMIIYLAYDVTHYRRAREFVPFVENQTLTPQEIQYLKIHHKVRFCANTYENSECSICLGTFEQNEEAIALPECRHLFHEICIDRWLIMNPICPYCRFNIRNNLQQRMGSR